MMMEELAIANNNYTTNNNDMAASSSNNTSAANNYEDLFPALPAGGKAPSVSMSNHASATNAMRVSSSKTTQIFTVPYGERKLDSDKFGEGESVRTCQAIMKDTGAHIELSSGRDQSLTFLVSGKANEVLEARRKILIQFQTQASKLVSIPREHHRWILGKKGERLRELEKNTATKITIPNANDERDTITITGTKEGIEKAEHELRVISDEQLKKAFERISVPKVFHPWVIGPHSETVNQISAETGARINIPPPSVVKDEIIVTGEKAGVEAAVRRIAAIHREMEKRCTTVNIEVPRAQHKYIIGHRGATLQEILKETDVSIEVPASVENSDTITLRGAPEKLGNALNVVYQKANSIKSVEIDAPSWIHKYIIGRRGDNIRKFNEEYPNVHIEFTENRIKMEGPPAQLDPAAERLEAVCSDYKKRYIHADLIVDPRHYKHIIGKGGSNIQKIKGDHDVTINIEEQDGTNRIRLEGTPEGVEAAKFELSGIINKLENEKERDVIIDHRLFRNLIGAKGERIREIRDKFNNVLITFPGPSEKTDIVKIRGPKEDVDSAFKYMTKLVKEMQESAFVMEVPIFKQFHKNIIGKGGANIKKIREETQTKIDLPEEGDKNEVIVITGKKENVMQARDLIQKTQETLANIVTEEITIPGRYHNSLIGSGGKLISAIMEECGGVSIKFPSADTKSDKVIIRGPKDDVERAKKTLLETSDELKLSSFTAEVKAKPQHHKFLIGKNGASIRKIRDATGARIIFPGNDDTDKETITIIGKKDDVEAARQQLEVIIKDIDNITEDEISIDPKYHKHFVARRGEVLHRIAEEFGGVMISFPRVGSESDRVTLKGAKNCIDGAKLRMTEIIADIDSMVTIECVISQRHHRNVMGSRGSKIQGITAEYDVQIKFPERETYEAAAAAGEQENGEPRACDIIRITGKKDKCEAAKQALLDSVPITREINVPFDLHRSIIGQKGRDVRELMNAHDVHIELSPPEQKLDIIKVTGAPSNVADAITSIEARVEELEADRKDRELRSFELKIEVDPDFHPKIIGRRGATINKIRANHNVQISFPKREEEGNSNVITIQGYEEATYAARDEIMSIVNEMNDMVKRAISIDARVHNRIIGQRGRHVKQIMEDFKVEIKFPRNDGTMNPNEVMIIGLEENVDNCVDHLQMLEEEFLQDVADLAPVSNHTTYTEIFEQTFKNKDATNRDGFVVQGAPWQKKGGKNAPNTASHEDFPGFGSNDAAAPAVDPKPSAGSAWTQYR